MAQGDDDVEVMTDADSSGERLLMLGGINSERTEDATEDAEDDQGVGNRCRTGWRGYAAIGTLVTEAN